MKISEMRKRLMVMIAECDDVTAARLYAILRRLMAMRR